MNQVAKQGKRALVYVGTLLQWVVVAAVTGGVGGLVGSAFHIAVEKVTDLRLSQPWLLFLLPVSGALIALLYQVTKLEKTGTDNVIDAVRTDRAVPVLLAPLIFVSTVLTHLVGGSAGREGAALQLGGSIGTSLGRLARFDEKDMHLITLCGMSAVFSALFGTPLTATLFSLEVISVGVVYYSGLIPCLISALIAYGISLLFNIEPVRFAFGDLPAYNAVSFVKLVGLAAACAAVSIAFCLLMTFTERGAQKLLKNAIVRAAAGGVLLIGLSLLFPNDYNGTGMDVIARAMQGDAVPWAFLLKMLFTAVTIGTGFKGGEIVPTFFIGATFGCVFGGWLGLPAGFSAAVGLVCLFCAVVNCPIASILLSLELFGGDGLLFFAVACAFSFALSGYFGLYRSQKILYSKTRAEFININAWQEIE